MKLSGHISAVLLALTFSLIAGGVVGIAYHQHNAVRANDQLVRVAAAQAAEIQSRLQAVLDATLTLVAEAPDISLEQLSQRVGEVSAAGLPVVGFLGVQEGGTTWLGAANPQRSSVDWIWNQLDTLEVTQNGIVYGFLATEGKQSGLLVSVPIEEMNATAAHRLRAIAMVMSLTELTGDVKAATDPWFGYEFDLQDGRGRSLWRTGEVSNLPGIQRPVEFLDRQLWLRTVPATASTGLNPMVWAGVVVVALMLLFSAYQSIRRPYLFKRETQLQAEALAEANERLGREIEERNRSVQLLRKTAHAVSETYPTGEFDAAASAAALLANADWTGVLLFDDACRYYDLVGQSRPLTGVDLTHVEVADTLAEVVAGGIRETITGGALAAFPKDRLLRELGAEQVDALPLWCADGTICGVFLSVRHSPGGLDPLTLSVLQIFARRIEAEIVWLKTREELARANEQLEQRVAESTQDFREAVELLQQEVTHRLQAEETLRIQRDWALRKSAEKASYLSTMSHEIRTPMNGLMGMLTLLQRTPLSAQQCEYLGRALESGDHLLHVVNDVLDLSKIEAGRMKLEPVEFDLCDLVESCTQSQAAIAAQKGLHLAAVIDPALRSLVVGDPNRLRQILVNLLVNAIKYTDSGAVVVRVAADLRDAAQIGLHISVEDTGKGVPEALRKELFERFADSGVVSDNKVRSTGLGLAISRQLTHLMGGEMGYESRPGEGSVFWLDLVLPRGKGAPVWLAGPVIEGLRGARVLLVSRVNEVAEQLRAVCAVWDVSLTVVPGEQEALNVINDETQAPYVACLVSPGAVDRDEEGFSAALKAIAAARRPRLIWLRQANGTEIGAAAETLYLPLRRTKLLLALAPDLPGSEALSAVLGDAADDARFHGYFALVVEDNEVNMQVAVEFLKKLGVVADRATDGEEALRLVAGRTYDIILMDCQMPVMDGYEATARIRELERDSATRVPIVAMTANALAEDRDKCMCAGMDGYLSKPMSTQNLARELGRWLVPSTQRPEPSVDDDTLSSLRSLMGGDFQALIDEFILDGTTHLSHMRQCLERGELNEMSISAGSLRDACMSLGAHDMVELLEPLLSERGTRAESAWSLLPSLESEFQRVSATLSRLVGKR